MTDALKGNATIERLFLIANQFGGQGAQGIEDMLKVNATLRFVDLQNNRLPDERKDALEALAKERGVELVL